MNNYTNSHSEYSQSKYFLLLNTIPYGSDHKRNILRIASCLNKEISEVKTMIMEARCFGNIIVMKEEPDGKVYCYIPEDLNELCEHAAEIWSQNSKEPDNHLGFYFDMLMDTIHDIYSAGNSNELTKHLFTD